MSDTTHPRGGDRADERPIADGGNAAAGPMRYRTVVDRTPGTSAEEVPRLGVPDDRHLFAPMTLPRESMALPVLAALAVAVGAQGTTVLAASGTPASVAFLGVPMLAIVAILLTLRYV